eukprot:5328888-Prymnesium_polylepis.1
MLDHGVAEGAGDQVAADLKPPRRFSDVAAGDDRAERVGLLASGLAGGQRLGAAEGDTQLRHPT